MGQTCFKKNKAYLKAMNEMQELMQKPQSMKDWFENKKKEFEELPESQKAAVPFLMIDKNLLLRIT